MFSAQCPCCREEVSQGPRSAEQIRELLRENLLSFFCDTCGREWRPSHQELVNVERLLLP